MHPSVQHSDQVKEYLRTSPHAEEARLAIEAIRRGQPPALGGLDVDGQTQCYCLLEDSGRFIWWFYKGPVLWIDEIRDAHAD